MAMEAVDRILAAEAEAEKTVADAAKHATELIQNAQKAGREEVEAVSGKVKEELRGLQQQTQANTLLQQKQEAERAAGQAKTIRDAAKPKIEETAQWIAERIVNG